MSDLVLHLARFASALRGRGVRLSLSDEADGLTALTLIDLGDRDEVRRALRAALKIRPRDVTLFEALFARLWQAPGEPAANPPIQAPRLGGANRPRPATEKRPRQLPPNAGVGPLPEGGEEPGYSPEAALRRKPFEEYSAADLVAMERLLARLALRLATRRSRRRVPVAGRGEVDL